MVHQNSKFKIWLFPHDTKLVCIFFKYQFNPEFFLISANIGTLFYDNDKPSPLLIITELFTLISCLGSSFHFMEGAGDASPIT